MSRYIDADEFWNNRPENLDPRKSEYNRGWDNYANEILKALKDTPTADVVEVRHGYLEHIADFGNGNCFGYCSECHAEHKADNPTALKFAYGYCRWCGAKMDGERREADEQR